MEKNYLAIVKQASKNTKTNVEWLKQISNEHKLFK